MHKRPLLLEQAANWCLSLIRDNKIPFFASIFTGLACYMFALTNKLINHDEVVGLFSKGGTVTSGRWGLGALDSIFPNYSMPWIYGLMAIILMAVSICIMIRCLSIRNKLLQGLFAGTVIAFPSLIGTFTYMFTVNSFALSFLLAVIAVRLLLEEKPFFCILALGIMVLSLSIYQSYISVAAGLLILIIVRRILNKEDIVRIICTGVGYVLFLAASLGLYYVGTQVILRVLGLQFNDYAASKIEFSIAAIPGNISTAYNSFFSFFTDAKSRMFLTPFSILLHWICLGLILVFLALHCIRVRSWKHILLLLALTGILPLAINCMYLFAEQDSIHILVLYGFVAFYGFVILLSDHWIEQDSLSAWSKQLSILCSNLLSVALTLIIICNCYIANTAFLNLHLRYENAYAFYTVLVSDLRSIPEFGPDKTLALIGDYQDPAFYSEKLDHIMRLTGATGFKPDSYSNEAFLDYYLGVKIPFADGETIAHLKDQPEVQEMPVYPYYGSILVVDQYIVVKLS